MRIHVIGCSGSFAGPDGAASSYLIEHEDADGRVWRVLMDLGSGAFGPLQKVIDPAELDAVIISHLHPDHYLDLTGLEVFWAYHSRTDLGKLPIHGPAPLPDRVSGVLGREGHIPAGVKTAPFDYHVLSDGHRFTIGQLEIETRAVLHPVEAYGFRITADGATFAYSDDTDSCEALDELATGADL
ncbi:MAG: MBL fold metallo-hydrolase, partial [Brachybacterium sp.]|nr:MBL fold metallo-hydrolase [Brachybacterium sp.]